MTNSLVRWLAMSPEDRQRDRDVAIIDRRGDLAQAQIDNIGRIAGRATYNALQINRLRQAAEDVAPDGAELYAMLAVAGTVAMADVIARANQRGGYRA